MPKISFEVGLAIGGFVLTILLVVLDKAGKLKGPVLLVLLVVAALMTVPLALGNPLVTDTSSTWKWWVRCLMVGVVAFAYWAIAIWISEGPLEQEASSGHSQLSGTPQDATHTPITPDNIEENLVIWFHNLDKPTKKVEWQSAYFALEVDLGGGHSVGISRPKNRPTLLVIAARVHITAPVIDRLNKMSHDTQQQLSDAVNLDVARAPSDVEYDNKFPDYIEFKKAVPITSDLDQHQFMLATDTIARSVMVTEASLDANSRRLGTPFSEHMLPSTNPSPSASPHSVLTFSALATNLSYPEGHKLAGITWRSQYGQVDFDLNNPQADAIQNIDLTIQVDKGTIYEIGQYTDITNVEFHKLDLPNTQIRFKSTNKAGEEGPALNLNLRDFIQKDKLPAAARKISCPRLAGKTPIRMVLATSGRGGIAEPVSIHIFGTYELIPSEGSKVVNVDATAIIKR